LCGQLVKKARYENFVAGTDICLMDGFVGSS
jgi:hypothetical protein